MTIESFQQENCFLSNFFILEFPIRLGSLEFNSVENAYVAAKTMNLSLRKEIIELKPGKAKRKGKEIEKNLNLKNPAWNNNFRLKLMEALVFQKFFKNPELTKMLLATGSQNLIEGNTWHDNFFGVCKCKDCLKNNQTGSNHLGKILMETRERLRKEKE